MYPAIKFTRLSVFIAAYVCLSFVLAGSVSAQKWGKITEEEWNMQPPDAYPDAKAVVIFDNGALAIQLGHDIYLDRHVRIKIFDKDGADDALTVEIPYMKDDKIKALKAHTITPEGKKKDIKEWFDKKVDELRVKTGTFPAVENGSILEFKYRQVHERYNFLDPWYFQSDLYTEKSRFSVTLDPGFIYNVASSNLPLASRKPKQEDTGTQTIFTWEVENLRAAKSEPYSCAREEHLASLRFQLVGFKNQYYDVSFLSNWSELGQSMEEYFSTLDDDPELIKRVADSICGSTDDIEEKTTRLFYYVRDYIETRDDIDDEEGKFSEVIERGYAGTTVKNILLVEFFRTQGIDAFPFLIGTRDEHGRLNPSVCQINQFNRALCYVKTESGGFALNPGSESSTYPYPSPIDLVEAGLLIDGSKSRIVDLYHRPRKSGIDLSSEITLHNDGTARCSTTIFIRGYDLDKYDEFIGDTLPAEKIVARLLAVKAMVDYEVVSATSLYDLEQDMLQFDFVLTLPEYGSFMDENIFFSPCILPVKGNPFIREERIFPIDFAYSFKNRQRTRIFLPEGFEIADVPQDVSMAIDGGRFTRSMVHDSTAVDISVNFRIDKPFFSTGEYRDLKDMFEAMELSGSDQVALMKTVAEAGE
jgi:hypothetical protein